MSHKVSSVKKTNKQNKTEEKTCHTKHSPPFITASVNKLLWFRHIHKMLLNTSLLALPHASSLVQLAPPLTSSPSFFLSTQPASEEYMQPCRRYTPVPGIQSSALHSFSPGSQEGEKMHALEVSVRITHCLEETVYFEVNDQRLSSNNKTPLYLTTAVTCSGFQSCDKIQMDEHQKCPWRNRRHSLTASSSCR